MTDAEGEARVVPPQVQVVRRSETYVIAGSKPSHLTEAMALAGPRRNGAVYAAYTDWEIAWQHEDLADASGHRPLSPQVVVTITSTYPRWRAPSSADPVLVRAFEGYVAAAVEHERGHADLAIETACDVFAALSALAPCESVTAMAEAARAAANEVLASARRRDVEYDAHTLEQRLPRLS